MGLIGLRTVVAFLFLLPPSTRVVEPAPCSEGSEAKLARAVTEIDRSLLQNAEATIRSALECSPSADGFFLLGYVLETQQRLDEARTAYLEALGLNADHEDAKLALGIVYGKMEQHVSVISTLEAIGHRAARNGEALFYLCRAHLETGRLDNALEVVSLVEKTGDDGALLSVAQLLVSKELYRPAIPLFEQVIEKFPDSPTALYSLALSLFKEQEYQRMWPWLEKALAIDPDDIKLLELQGMALLDLRRMNEAEEILRRAQHVDPENLFLQYLWGRLLIEGGKFQQAVEVLEELTAQNKDDFDVHNLLVIAYRGKGDFARALSQAENLTDRFPNEPRAFMSAASEFMFDGNLMEAEKCYRVVLASSSADPLVTREASLRLAQALSRQGNYSEAEELLRPILERDSDDTLVRIELGRALLGAGEADSAVVMLTEARNLDPSNKEARFLLGRALTLSGNSKAAEEEFAAFQQIEEKEREQEKAVAGVYAKTGN